MAFPSDYYKGQQIIRTELKLSAYSVPKVIQTSPAEWTKLNSITPHCPTVYP